MKKILSMVLLLTFLLVGCIQKKQPVSDNVTSLTNPPELTVTVDTKSITAVLGTYSWNIDNGDGTVTSIESDSEAPPELAKDQNEALIVKQKSSIVLNFENKPTDYIVNIWEGNTQSTHEVINGEIIAPQQKGLVVFEVYAHWKEGSAYYAFSVNID
ncbi:hypothetical protein [Oceanirhabdus seepicola]|uniref:DUF4625 domain-containing protein n=1 Tax=Oceanirhabdus seepicola TaxID=2828781 RepID=A0A9J6NXP4_9CLOT|nr:hypothetical protein [Oceanirhabdus seepicola]MCM1989226.1 hypothetical protein [Oceanirhabdus seepicola]